MSATDLQIFRELLPLKSFHRNDLFKKDLERRSHSDALRHRDLILLDLLVEQLNHGLEIDDEAIFEKLYPNRKFRAILIHQAFTRLYQAQLEFITWRNSWRVPLVRYEALLAFFNQVPDRNPRLIGDMEKVHRSATAFIRGTAREVPDPLAYADGNALHAAYRVENEAHKFYMSQTERTFDGALPTDNAAVTLLLDEAYILDKLRLAAADLNQQRINPGVARSADSLVAIEALLPLLKAKVAKMTHRPLIQIYFQICKTLTPPYPKAAYHRLCTLLDKHRDAMPADHQRDAYQYVLNYVVRRILQGKKEFQKELCHHFDYMLPNGLMWGTDGILPIDSMKNVVASYLRVGKVAKARQVLHTYGNRLGGEAQEVATAKLYNLGVIECFAGNFQKAKRLLYRVFAQDKRRDDYLQLDARVYWLLALFQLGEQPLTASLNTTRVFIRRRSALSPLRRERYLQFVKNLRRMDTLFNRPRQFEDDREAFLRDVAKLRLEIQRQANFAARDELIKILDSTLKTGIPPDQREAGRRESAI